LKNINIKLYKNIIFFVILYGCESWSLALSEEHRLRVFENRKMRRILGQKRNEVTGSWRKLHKEELRHLYSSLSIMRVLKSRRMRWSGNVAGMEKRNEYTSLVGNPEGKRQLGRQRRKWVDNTKIGPAERACGSVHWTGLAKDSNNWTLIINVVMKHRGL
jgi:hypothetical protein